MFAKLKEMFGLYKFAANSKLIDGTEIAIEGDLTEGVSVFVITDEEPIALPDGSYELEDGNLITVVDGLITDVSEKPEDETEVEDEVEAETEAVETETETETESETETEVGLEEKIMSMEERISKLEESLSTVEASAELSKQENEDLKKKNDEFSAENLALNDKVSNFETKLSKMDGAEPVPKKKTETNLEVSSLVSNRVSAINQHKKVLKK